MFISYVLEYFDDSGCVLDEVRGCYIEGVSWRDSWRSESIWMVPGTVEP